MTDHRFAPLEATLHGGPEEGETLIIRGTPTWPEYLCVTPDVGRLPMHYRHVAAGAYEFIAPCAEVGHPTILFRERCADCGTPILGGEHVEM